MPNSEQKLKESLKSLIKEQGFTYKKLATKMSVSEVTIKRWLNKDDLSLKKLTELLRILNIELLDFIELSQKQEQRTTFTHEQENCLVKEPLNFQIFRQLILGQTYSSLLEINQISEVSLIKKLKALEDIQLIELHPHNQIKLKAKFPFKWIENGPLEKYYFRDAIQKISQHALAHAVRPGPNCRPFEMRLTGEQRNELEENIESLYLKYQDIAKTNIRRNRGEVTSGIFYVDQFEVW